MSSLLGLRAHWAVHGSHAFIATHSKLLAQDLVAPVAPGPSLPQLPAGAAPLRLGHMLFGCPWGQETPYLLDMA